MIGDEIHKCSFGSIGFRMGNRLRISRSVFPLIWIPVSATTSSNIYERVDSGLMTSMFASAFPKAKVYPRRRMRHAMVLQHGKVHCVCLRNRICDAHPRVFRHLTLLAL